MKPSLWTATGLVLLAAAACPLCAGSSEIGEARGGGLVLGADVSSLHRTEEFGGTFRDKGRKRDVFSVLRENGMNWIRLRIFVKPTGLWGAREDLDAVLKLARRARKAGFKVLLAFHCSDTWADPKWQEKPAAWKDLAFPELKKALREYTESVVGRFKANGALPDMVQIGNEIDGGMLWPDGALYGESAGGWDNLVELVRAGQEGVRAAAGPGFGVKFLHQVAMSGNAGLHLREMAARGMRPDVLGVSYYPWWHGSMAVLEAGLRAAVEEHGIDVVIVETAYPWRPDGIDGWGNIFNPSSDTLPDPFPMTPEGQRRFTEELHSLVSRLPGGHGKGIIWWEPAWISIGKTRPYRKGEMVNRDDKGNVMPPYGSCVENVCLFNERGESLPALGEFGEARRAAFRSDPDENPAAVEKP